jgi:hypothetical protein
MSRQRIPASEGGHGSRSAVDRRSQPPGVTTPGATSIVCHQSSSATRARAASAFVVAIPSEKLQDRRYAFGSGGRFLVAVQTLERVRECFFRVLLSSAENFERCKRDGGLDATACRGDLGCARGVDRPPLDEAVRAERSECVTRRRAEFGD